MINATAVGRYKNIDKVARHLIVAKDFIGIRTGDIDKTVTRVKQNVPNSIDFATRIIHERIDEFPRFSVVPLNRVVSQSSSYGRIDISVRSECRRIEMSSRTTVDHRSSVVRFMRAFNDGHVVDGKTKFGDGHFAIGIGDRCIDWVGKRNTKCLIRFWNRISDNRHKNLLIHHSRRERNCARS